MHFLRSFALGLHFFDKMRAQKWKPRPEKITLYKIKSPQGAQSKYRLFRAATETYFFSKKEAKNIFSGFKKPRILGFRIIRRNKVVANDNLIHSKCLIIHCSWYQQIM